MASPGLRLPAPKPPPYSVAEWREAPWRARMRMASEAWAIDGYGAPLAIYLLYLIKAALYVLGWWACCHLNSDFRPDAPLADQIMTATSFQKALVWSLCFEVLGLGCGSGPLTGRYWPPVAAPLHFARPGTVKLPPWPSLPVFGSTRRGWLDVALYIALLGASGHVLLAPEVTPVLLLPIVVAVALLGLSDKTLFLAARAEHYWAMLVCFCFVDQGIAGAMVVATAIWMWAAISKLTHHFPSVLCVMTSNSPLLRWGWIRRAMYRDFPGDLRPSRLAHVAAHLGTFVELGFPILLLMGDGGTLTFVGLAAMVLFHSYITSHVPMGVPIEWNLAVVYGGFFLFGTHASVSPLHIDSPLLLVFVAISAAVVPLVGQLFPHRTSFLMAMRYYAGNWAYSVWLFRGDAEDKLEAIPKASPHPREQLARFYDEDTITSLMSKVPAFRAMHLHGRALYTLIPQAVDDIEDYAYADGEIIAGMVLGYNFGDGHLHDHRLLQEVQDLCEFAPGQLRHIFVESQPLFRPRLHWEIRDAATGLIDHGVVTTKSLLASRPFDTAV